MAKVYVGDIGVVIKVNCEEDLTGADSHHLRVKKPSGTIETWETSIASGTWLHHTTASGDLNEAGTYKVNPYVDHLPSFKGHGDMDSFIVVNPGQ